MRCLVAVLLMVLVMAVRGSASEPAFIFGINHDFVWTEDRDIPGLVQAMKDAHVHSVRMGIRWTSVEPERGKWNWDKVDSVVKQIRAADIEILCCLMSVPAWASETTPDLSKGFWDTYAPKHMTDWSGYVGKVVRRYKGDIHYWEIWNEENGQDFYKPEPDAKVYVQILKSAHDAVRAADPKATVVLGGLQMNGIIPNPWSPLKVENFLQKIYDAGGKPYFDIVNIHPYVGPAPDQGPLYCAKLVKATVGVMKKNGDDTKPLWITEVGLPTGNGVTEEMQAEHLKGIYRELGKIPEVRAIFWFELRDYPAAICGGEESMGILAQDARRKPSFSAYQELAAK